jgi:hypothetical protein
MLIRVSFAFMLYCVWRLYSNVSTVIILLSIRGNWTTSCFEMERPSLRLAANRARPIGSKATLPKMFTALIKNLPSTTIRAGNEHPMLYVYYLAQLFNQAVMSRLCNDEQSMERWTQKAFNGDSSWLRYSFEFEANVSEYAFRLERTGLQHSLRNLRGFKLAEPIDTTPIEAIKMRESTILDYEELSSRYNDLLERLYSIESRSISHRGSLSSVDTAEQSASLQHLTVMAFFFIPLSFVTSVFGMNMTVLGSGTAKVSTVAICSVVTLCLVTVMWITSGFVGQSARQLRRNLDGVKFRWRVLKLFARISPTGSFWLFLYGLTHDLELFSPLVQQLGIWVVLGLGKEWEAPEIGTSKQTLPLSRFWQARANSIAQITKEEGWEKKTFWDRWRLSKQAKSDPKQDSAVSGR